MTAGDKRQVRWSMLYLGKYKAERAIPLLLKYLDYQYTTSPLLEESFPALRALINIGKPAAKAALEANAQEQDNRRLELLMHLVLRVHGATEGKQLIKTALAGIEDAAQQDRVQAALLKAMLPQPSAIAFPETTN
jgi:hypothetical protein